MNIPAATYNIAALTFSLIAILISFMTARRQSDDVRRSNFTLFMTELGQRSRTQDFRKAEIYIHAKLSNLDPALGVYDLPEPARSHVLLVGGFYQDLGLLVVSRVMDKEFAAVLYYFGIKDSWRVLEPYIRGERAKRKSRFFGAFENLAAYVESMPVDKVRRKYLRHSFPAPAINSASPAVEAIDSVPAEAYLG